MPSAKARLGRFGEAAAAAYLQRNGFALVARNWRCSAGEIDLVATDGDQVIFVEVRTRRAGGATPVPPETSVNAHKARRLVQLAYAYLAEHEGSADRAWRIDVIAVEVDRAGRIARLEHIEHAVEIGS
ncbi:MAG: YraN family protein [Oscillochloridaceae bacterium]|nr:YraN family protein [Chloroflexaceae bacterium]MDW8390177.1 YraN family protein [Oscillochloridaceae bacterium]